MKGIPAFCQISATSQTLKVERDNSKNKVDKKGVKGGRGQGKRSRKKETNNERGEKTEQ